jgi:crotonobetainyl-CoA:carnitine CoA-transferase CaiB-like acyl-CoA transferase
LLADFGAEVIKVEPPEGDAVRSMGKHFEGSSLYAASILRNKSLISANLRTDEGRDIIRKLATKCDILIENFRPGTLEKWGLGYDTLSAINPALVMVRISGYGQTGPYRQRPGYGVIGEAMSGLRHITGDPDRPPSRIAASVADNFTGLYAAFGAVMALMEMKKSGKGQIIDAALYESAFSFMEPHIPAFEKLGHVANRAGSSLPDSTPNNLYPTKDQKHIHITAMADAVFKRLAEAMSMPELAEDERYATARARSINHDAVDKLVASWCQLHSLEELESRLLAADVPAMRIFTMADIFKNEHYKAREMLAVVPHESLGKVTMAGVVPKLSRTPGALYQSGGKVGRDTRRVLTDLVGLSDNEISRLAKDKVILCG